MTFATGCYICSLPDPPEGVTDDDCADVAEMYGGDSSLSKPHLEAVLAGLNESYERLKQKNNAEKAPDGDSSLAAWCICNGYNDDNMGTCSDIPAPPDGLDCDNPPEPSDDYPIGDCGQLPCLQSPPRHSSGPPRRSSSSPYT